MGLKELLESRRQTNEDIKSAHDRKSELDGMIKKADRLERTTGSSGAVPLTPKRDLLDASDVQEKHPDKHLRFVRVTDDENVELRNSQGYTRLPSADGGKEVGRLALFSVDKDKYETGRAEIKAENARRLEAHRGEVEQVAEAVARQLRDNHGIDISAERLMDTTGGS